MRYHNSATVVCGENTTPKPPKGELKRERKRKSGLKMTPNP